MYLLDTVALSELRRASGRRADPGFAAWAQAVSVRRLYLSTVSIFEIERGVLLKERADPSQGSVLRSWFETQVVGSFDGRVISISGDIARRAASFSVPDPAPLEDALIAATAAELGMHVVTRNVRDFERFDGVEIINPWSG